MRFAYKYLKRYRFVYLPPFKKKLSGLKKLRILTIEIASADMHGIISNCSQSVSFGCKNFRKYSMYTFLYQNLSSC